MHRFLVALAVAAGCSSAPAPHPAPSPIVPVHADEMPGLSVSQYALDTLTRGLDTATTEHGFCAVAHMDTVVHFAAPLRLTEAQVHIVLARTADSITAQTDSTVDFMCPGNELAVHWHLDDRGFYDFPSPADKRTLLAVMRFRKATAPYDLIVARDGAGHFHFVVFSVDQYARR